MKTGSDTGAKARGSRRHRSLFLSITFTFITLCAVFVVSSAAYLAINTDSLRREQTRMGLSESNNAAAYVQDKLGGYLQLCNVIAANASVRTLPAMLRENPSRWNSVSIDIRSELLSAHANYGDVHLETVAVYYPAENVLITSRMAYSSAVIGYFLDQFNLPDTFLPSIPHARRGVLFQADGFCWFTRGIYQDGEIYAFALLEIPLDKIAPGDFRQTDRICIRKEGEIVYLSSGTLDEDALDSNAWNEGPVRLGDGRFYVQSRNVKSVGLEIISLRDAEESLRETRAFLIRGVLIIAVILLVMLALGLVFTFRIYRPIQRLLTNAMIVTPASSVSSAMGSVTSTLEKISEEKRRYQQSVEEAKFLVQGDRLQQILSLPEEIFEDEFFLFLEELHFDPNQPITGTPIFYDPKSLAVLLASMPEQFSKNHNRFYSILIMLLSEILGEKLHFELFKYAGFFILLTEYRGEADMALLRQTLADVSAYFQSSAPSGITYADPYRITSAKEIQAWLNREPGELSGMMFGASPRAANPQEAPLGSPPYLQKLNTLSLLYETCNWAEARECTLRLLDEIYAEGNSFRYCVYRVHGLLSLILIALHKNESALSGVIRTSAYERRLFEAENLSQLKAEVRAILDDLMALTESEEQGASVVAEKMQRFIGERYADHALSLSTLADAFSMSKSAISRVFREECGMTYLEYIQLLRVRKAKELLATETVKDAAKAVGFWDTQSLIRVFKKYEGITPGQYKELLAQKG